MEATKLIWDRINVVKDELDIARDILVHDWDEEPHSRQDMIDFLLRAQWRISGVIRAVESED